MREVQSRLAALYPDYAIAHLPSDAIQRSLGAAAVPGSDTLQSMGSASQGGGGLEKAHEVPAAGQTCDAVAGRLGAEAAAVDCNQFVANAAVYGDCFQWHLDADPSGAAQDPCQTLSAQGYRV